MNPVAPRTGRSEGAGRAEDAVQQFLIGQAVDAGPTLVFVADDQGRYAAVNQRVCETLGYTRAELLGMEVTDVAVAADAPDLYEAMLQQRRATGVTLIRCKDGRLLPLRYSAAEVTVVHMTFWVSIGVIESEAPLS
jgi:PAS domain S-box-containing protein